MEYVNEKYRLDFPESENYDTLAGYVIDKVSGHSLRRRNDSLGQQADQILRTNASRIELIRVTIV
ncbi:MAG: transporter associated domain-containing protein [Alistipes sp.]